MENYSRSGASGENCPPSARPIPRSVNLPVPMPEMQSAAAAPVHARKWTPGVAWSRWAPWLNRGALSSIDQGLVSGANFALSIMLARWLPISDYGGYSFALSIFMLINAAQQALFLEPMSVLGAS